MKPCTNLASYRDVVRITGLLAPRTFYSLSVDVGIVNGHYGVGGCFLCRKTAKQTEYPNSKVDRSSCDWYKGAHEKIFLKAPLTIPSNGLPPSRASCKKEQVVNLVFYVELWLTRPSKHQRSPRSIGLLFSDSFRNPCITIFYDYVKI